MPPHVSRLERVLLRNQLDIIAAANGRAGDVVRVYARAIERLAAGLTERSLAEQTRRQALIRQLQRALFEGDSTHEPLNGRVERIIGTARSEVIRQDFGATIAALATDAGVDAPLARIPARTVEALLQRPIGGAPLREWVDGMSRRVVANVRQELAASRIEGVGIREISRRLMDIPRSGLTRSGAQVLARTTLLDAADAARREVWQEMREVIDFFEYLATLDSRTCPVCFPDDGKRFPDLRSAPRLPRHPNCRCILAARVKGQQPIERPAVRSYKVSEGEDPARGHLVHHRDGSTSRRFTPDEVGRYRDFDHFFNDQGADYQRSFLGPTRYEMWRSGEVSLDEFREGNRVLTLRQLANRMRSN